MGTRTHQYIGGRTREGKSKYIQQLEEAADERTPEEREIDETFEVDEVYDDADDMGIIDRVFEFFSGDDDDVDSEDYTE